MTRGRKPKPFFLKAYEGNRGHRKLKPGVEPPAGPFEPPFPLDGFAKAEWNRITSEAFWLRATEAGALADRCLCAQRLLEAEEDIRQRGSLVRTRSGKVANPSIRIARNYRTSIQRYDAELGLTPSSRGRIDEGGMPLPANPKVRGMKMDDPLETALCV